MSSLMKVVCYYEGTGLDVLNHFESVDEFQNWKVNRCEAYIVSSLREGYSISTIKTVCQNALETLHNEILAKVGDEEFTLKTLKKLWREDFIAKCGMWYMNVACLIKLGVLQDDEMNGWMIIPPEAMDLLKASGGAIECSLAGHRCGVCKKETSNKCSGCRTVYYCGAECQRADWKCHKPNCQIKHK